MPASADDILVRRAQEDFEEGLTHARAQLRKDHNRFVAASLDAVLMGTLSALRVREEMQTDVRFLLGLAHRVAQGEAPEAIATQNIGQVLRLKQKMHFLARESDPAFQDVLAICRTNMAKRLPDLARMATVPDPADYADIVKRAFPERAHVDRIVDENVAFTLEILAHLEKHPHVLRLPQALIPKIATIARGMIDWQTQRVKLGVEDIYSHAPPAAAD